MAVLLGGTAIRYDASLHPVETSTIEKNEPAAAGVSDARDGGTKTVPLFIYQPPEKDREYVQAGRIDSLSLDAFAPGSSSKITDGAGNEIPCWLLVRWLDGGGAIVVSKPVEKFLVHLALGLKPWQPDFARIVAWPEFMAMRTE